MNNQILYCSLLQFQPRVFQLFLLLLIDQGHCFFYHLWFLLYQVYKSAAIFFLFIFRNSLSLVTYFKFYFFQVMLFTSDTTIITSFFIDFLSLVTLVDTINRITSNSRDIVEVLRFNSLAILLRDQPIYIKCTIQQRSFVVR